VAVTHVESLLQRISALGLPPAAAPPRQAAPVSVLIHTEFGSSSKHGLFAPLFVPLSHSSLNALSDTPSPHIGPMQAERQAFGTSSRLPAVPARQLPPVHWHRSPAPPVCGLLLVPWQSSDLAHSAFKFFAPA
jgi:hypothetical protein